MNEYNKEWSVNGYVIYLNNCVIARKRRRQKTVALSSTEVECIALSQVITEIINFRNFKNHERDNMG